MLQRWLFWFQDSSDEDEFEVVPQEPDDETDVWDADDEDQDEKTKSKIRSKRPRFRTLFLSDLYL